MIVNAGVIRVVHQGDFNDELALEVFNKAGVEVVEMRL